VRQEEGGGFREKNTPPKSDTEKETRAFAKKNHRRYTCTHIYIYVMYREEKKAREEK